MQDGARCSPCLYFRVRSGPRMGVIVGHFVGTVEAPKWGLLWGIMGVIVGVFRSTSRPIIKGGAGIILWRFGYYFMAFWVLFYGAPFRKLRNINALRGVESSCYYLLSVVNT